MIIIPAIDLRGGRCVRLTQGQATAETVYSQNPVVVAKRWCDEGAEILHIVNLDAALSNDDERTLKALERILYEVNIPVQFGGGVRSLDDVRRLDELGATRIVIGTTAIENPVLLSHIIDEFGSTIVVGIDARDGKVALRGWEKISNIEAVDLALKVSEMGVERIVYTDISRDGMLSGINLEATRQIAETSGVKVTASGGVASLDDIYAVKELEQYGVDSLIIGKALYEGVFTLEEALDAADSGEEE
ncbi:MAG: 1-(5-phosphoribosyl)-5-[(5-phosphoribosylamino)methylideneamino]imidazole-4-carboxamide isomerase [Acidobacteria bacterium]|nr:1-(5-phosphoribosyl)-5-[(5-phosphoribosylamino)methylideneamino]imidazole-4-carboxamide isomerase [Acidobacteriota bacterium]MBK7601685.1 1-(5-phosphoribosyl)-5-[(5-phosphoribosylamino)methylideneamino]imidazole-4-carboxamide isomerase [Acidobacteriota bacterium]